MSLFTRKTPLFVALALTIVTAPLFPAQAQTQAPQQTPAPAKANANQKPQFIDIEDGSDVDGERHNPHVELIGARGQLRPSSLITVRSDFKNEMLKSVERL